MTTPHSDSDPATGMSVDEAIRLLLRRGATAFRKQGAPHARFVHIDRLPCLLPLIAGGGVALVAASVAAWAAAGGALFGGAVFAALLWVVAPVPHVQALLADRLVLRRWWLKPHVLLPADVKRLFQVHAVSRDGRVRRSLFEVEAVPEGSSKPIKHRFIISAAPVAERLRTELEAAGFAPIREQGDGNDA